ncbi:hypothetical protein Cfast33896_05870 [Coprobacter fastidiosus]|nr:hypothetical protein Cfast33896_05870 [Coprobacter fastidiosus]
MIVLACSKHLEREKGESDTLVKVLWSIVLIPLVLFAVFFYNHTVEKKRELRKIYQIKEVAPQFRVLDIISNHSII